MTSKIQRDERVWKITISSESCPLVFEAGIVESCRSRSLRDMENIECTLENCPKRIITEQP